MSGILYKHMMKYCIIVLYSLCIFSCNKSTGWPPPAVFTAVLMDSDSTSVITSEKDKIVVNFNENGTVRQLYDISLNQANLVR